MKLAVVGAIAIAGGFLYLWLRLVRPFEPRSWSRVTLTCLLIVLFLLLLWFPLTWFFPVGLEGTRFEPMRHWSTFLAMGFVVLLGLVSLVRDVLLLGQRVIRRFTAHRSTAAWRDDGIDGGRRRFIRQSTSLGAFVATGLFGAGSFAGSRRLVVEHIDVPIRDLAPTLSGLRIAQISDLHVGHTIGRGFVESVLRTVNTLNADLIVITGDLTDGTVEMLREAIAPLAELDAPLGVYYVTGNHEYYWGDAEGWVAELRRLGLQPLVNEHVLLSRGEAAIVLGGVTDFRAGDYISGHRSDPHRAFSSAPEGVPRVLLAHQPRTVESITGLNVDLQLSGHTHGGQIFPFHFAALLTQPLLSGLQRFGETWLYVNRGTGYWGPPFRLFSSAEVSVLTLVREE